MRCIVLATGTVAALLGVLAIGLATVPAWARFPALVFWVALSFREFVVLRRGWRRCHRVRFLANGGVEIRDGGLWKPAGLADGSVLLRRLGWLRLVTDDGAVIHELVRGSCRADRDWRRLHVIWRHV